MSNECKTCRFYNKEPLQPKSGSCRFSPPVPQILPGPGNQPVNMSVYPVVQENSWCGKWQSALVTE